MQRRTLALAASGLTALTLTAAVLTNPAASAAKPTGAAPSATAEPTATARYQATIQVTEHGIPHITASNFAGLGYGAGWAIADSSICAVMDGVLTMRGERSRYFGGDVVYNDGNTNMTNLDSDTIAIDLHNRQVVEKLLKDPLRGPSARTKTVVAAEAAGINAWLSSHTIADPACAGQPWLVANVTPIDIWYLLYQSQVIGGIYNGTIGSAITAATVPTTPGRPSTEAPLAPTDAERSVIRSMVPNVNSLGSNATAVGKSLTSTGKGMVLGNPHFPWWGRYRFTQQQLTIPGKYNVAGGSLLGFPGVNIGWNKNVAWSHTVSLAQRFTLYEYQTAGSPTTYWRQVGKKKVKKSLIQRDVEVPVLVDGTVTTVKRSLYRTVDGYVLNLPPFIPWTQSAFWAVRDVNSEHLRTIDTFLNMGFAKNAKDLIKRQDAGGGMPWANTVVADRAGNVIYADHSVTPHVTNAQLEKCTTVTGSMLYAVAGIIGLDGSRAGTDCAWGVDKDSARPGVFGPKKMPMAKRTDWVMNANDSYWLPNPKQPLTGYSKLFGCEECVRSLRTQMVSRYVLDDVASGTKITPERLASYEFANRSLAAERAKAGGKLDELCARTGQDDACQILHDWDGTYQADSVGPILFQKFLDAGGASIWATQWSPKAPLDTPNTLKTDDTTVALLTKAIEDTRAAGLLTEPWGSVNYRELADGTQIPLGGGPASAGQANAVGGVPVSGGSSHIQAIAFLPNGGVWARTLLTYGQSPDPASPYYADQTELFSHNTWVDFAWTPAQIAAQQVGETIQLAGD